LIDVKFKKEEYFSECPVCLISFEEGETIS
jgi:hypothetical protein